jgi:hypothetical protein
VQYHSLKSTPKGGKRLIGESTMKALTDEEAAQILQVAPNTLRKWRCYRTGPAYVRMGRCIRYLEKDLAEYLMVKRIDPKKIER